MHVTVSRMEFDHYEYVTSSRMRVWGAQGIGRSETRAKATRLDTEARRHT